MAAPTFPLVTGQTNPGDPSTGVTVALTLVTDGNNPVLGDLHLLNGQIHFWAGTDARLQKIYVVLQFFKGEWWLNPEEGMPYIQSIIGVAGVSRTVVLSLFRQALLGIPGAARLQSLNFALNNTTRTARVDFELLFDDGVLVTSAMFGPLLIKVP